MNEGGLGHGAKRKCLSDDQGRTRQSDRYRVLAVGPTLACWRREKGGIGDSSQCKYFTRREKPHLVHEWKGGTNPCFSLISFSVLVSQS